MSTAVASTRVRVAVLDSDQGFARALETRFQGHGWHCTVLDKPPAIGAVASLRVSAVVIDPSLVGRAWWPYLEKLTASHPELAIIVCATTSQLAERVRAFRAGIDHWLTKPCHPEEVAARVESVVRVRRSRPESDTPIRLSGELEIRSDRFQVLVAGRSADLTRREFELLTLLSVRDGEVLPREVIYERVWGYALARGDRSVDVFVRKLRQKLQRVSPRWRYIHTHFGVGYRFAPEPLDAVAADAAEAPSSAAELVPA